MANLRIRPIAIRDAKKFVALHHRHHPAPQGAKFAIAAILDGALVGVSLVGRPNARKTEERKHVGEYVAEVIRVACLPDLRDANGHSAGVCSKLYSRSKRIAELMGYDRVTTKILDDEGGASLRGAGWEQTGVSEGGTWDRPSRARVDKHPTGPKKTFERPSAPRRPLPTEVAR